jgi:hypothetical protein
MKHTRKLILTAAVAALWLSTTAPVALAAQDVPAEWRPVASERLIKLPSTYLKRAIDRDFATSGLAGAITDTDKSIDLKKQTLGDLSDAAEASDGELRIELRHQVLAEKQAFIKLMGERQEMRHQQEETRIRLYRSMLRKLDRQTRANTPAKKELIDRQVAAKQRFEGSLQKVDMKLFASGRAPESRHAKEFSKNVGAIEGLVQAISNHPMNREAEIDGQKLSKCDYLRQLMIQSESRITLLEQEEKVLGYMAKLVALDAMAFAEEVEETLAGGDGGAERDEDEGGVASADALFIRD